MYELIKNYFKENNHFIMDNELKKILKIKGEEGINKFYETLEKLVEDGILFFEPKKGYKLFTNDLGYAYGEIEINKSGNGFVNTKDGYTIFISYEDLNGALNGDKVIISSIDFGRRDQFKGEVYKVLKRKTGNIIFEVIGNGLTATLVPYNKNEQVLVNINKNELRKLVDGEIILVKVGIDKIENEYIGEVSKVIGHKNDADMDLRLIYEKYDVPIEFSHDALKEAENMPTEVSEKEIEGRIDLRDKDIITIDCDDTKDRDDAVYVEKLTNGNFRLYTSISHVSNYVKKGSKLFEEVSKRIISHYPNGTCNPMLPPKLSNGICSLNSNVDRLVRTFELEIDTEGKIVGYNDYKAVIKSRKAMKYSDVNKIFAGNLVDGYEPYINQLNLLNELNSVLESARQKRGCIDFDIPDIEIKKDENGKTEKFIETGNGLAERIIENCMLVTGTAFAENYYWLPLPFRVHETPNPETFKNVLKILRTSGFNLPKLNNVDERAINSILEKIKNTEEAKIIRLMLLKSMKKARYDINNVGHFALQLKNYCQVTSPIRRVDFWVHVLLDELENFDYSKESIDELEKQFDMICNKASETEKIAKLIEDEALLMEMAKYMENHIGEKYFGMVTEIYPHGMFVKTNENISGKIKFENMVDDRYFYDYDKKAIIGKNTKRKYQIGNRVCVVVKDACKETRTIDFEIGNKKSLRKRIS